MTINAVLFDMDGVLCDSEPFIAEAAIAMFADVFQTTVTEADFTPFIGTGEDRYLGGVAEAYGLPLELPQHKVRTYELYLELIKGRLQALPGVHAFIDQLAANDRRRAVASAADRMKVDGNLGEIGLPESRFDAVITGSDTTNKKPHPECYLTAARRVGVDPRDCLVVEDAVNGIQAAKAAGCRALGICSSFAPATLLAAGADWCAPDLSQVPADCLAALGLA